ncbi:MAG: hypothetical protein AAF219_04135 [Myxococcota bacterium]
MKAIRFETLTCVLAFAAVSSTANAAGLRSNENRSIGSDIAKLQAGTLFDDGYLDVTKGPYNADPSCSQNSDAAFEKALEHSHDFNYTVYVPKGSYCFTRSIEMLQIPDFKGGKSNRKHFPMMVGDDANGSWPTLRLRDGTALGNLRGNTRAKDPDGHVDNAFIYAEFDGAPYGPSHYMTTLRGFNIDLGDNPEAAGISFSGAQGVSLEDIHIFGDRFRVGIDEFPGSGGSAKNIEITGGQWGAEHGTYRPSPSIEGLKCRDNEFGCLNVKYTRGVFIVAGFDVASSADDYIAFRTQDTLEGSFSGGNLILLDGKIDAAQGTAISGESTTVVARNVYARTETLFVNGTKDGEPERFEGDPGRFLHTEEYAHAAARGKGYFLVDGAMTGGDGKDYVRVTTPVAVSEDSIPNYLTIHAWDPKRFPSRFNSDVVRVTEFGATPDNGGRPSNLTSPKDADDDANAINAALRAVVDSSSTHFGKAVFIPRGIYDVKGTIDFPIGAVVLGPNPSSAVIQASSDWEPATRSTLCRTEDGLGFVVLSGFACNGHRGVESRGVASHRLITVFEGRSSQLRLRGFHLNVFGPNTTRVFYEAPFVVFSGNAGGKVWDLPFDYGSVPGRDVVAAPGVRMILVDGTRHPLALYQFNTERNPASPQTEIRDSKNVTVIGAKMEAGHDYAGNSSDNVTFMRIANSQNISVFGGSGNYALEGQDTVYEVVDSEDVFITLLQRQGKDLGPAKCWVKDGAVCAPYDINLMHYFKRGEPRTYGEWHCPRPE